MPENMHIYMKHAQGILHFMLGSYVSTHQSSQVKVSNLTPTKWQHFLSLMIHSSAFLVMSSFNVYCDCWLKTPLSGDTKPHKVALLTTKHQNTSNINSRYCSTMDRAHSLTLAYSRGKAKVKHKLLRATHHSSETWQVACAIDCS